VVSHILDFGDAAASPVGDAAYPAGDAGFSSGDAVIYRRRCDQTLSDVHLPQNMRHLPRDIGRLQRKMPRHLQNSGYVTLLIFSMKKYLFVMGFIQVTKANVFKMFFER
jgi:hypothetical protein